MRNVPTLIPYVASRSMRALLQTLWHYHRAELPLLPITQPGQYAIQNCGKQIRHFFDAIFSTRYCLNRLPSCGHSSPSLVRVGDLRPYQVFGLPSLGLCRPRALFLSSYQFHKSLSHCQPDMVCFV